MNQLPRVIGPAPSELPFSEFMQKLSEERKRAAREIALYQKGNPNSTYAQEVSAILRKAGISGEKLQELIKEKMKCHSGNIT